MEPIYKMDLNTETGVLTIGFGAPSTNAEMVKIIPELIREIKRKSGPIRVLKINGPASLPIAVMIGASLCGWYDVVSVFDPKLGGYVVVDVDHMSRAWDVDNVYTLGVVIPA